jgi:hypothetical protein
VTGAKWKQGRKQALADLCQIEQAAAREAELLAHYQLQRQISPATAATAAVMLAALTMAAVFRDQRQLASALSDLAEVMQACGAKLAAEMQAEEEELVQTN